MEGCCEHGNGPRGPIECSQSSGMEKVTNSGTS